MFTDFKRICRESVEKAKRRSTQYLNIKVEEILLDDLVWEVDCVDSSGSRQCNLSKYENSEIQSTDCNTEEKSTNNNKLSLNNGKENTGKYSLVLFLYID